MKVVIVCGGRLPGRATIREAVKKLEQDEAVAAPPEKVAELRDKTNYSLMSCKIAMQRAGGDIAKAEEILCSYPRLEPNGPHGFTVSELVEAGHLSPPEPPAPIDMVLHCPNCGMQHIDAPEGGMEAQPDGTAHYESAWTNLPHRSHLCQNLQCGHIWRPADVPTNGVAAIKTQGKNDSSVPTDRQRCAASLERAAEFLAGLGAPLVAADLRRTASLLTKGENNA